MVYIPEKHHRRSIRLNDYDYSQEGIYFITMCVRDRKHLLGKVENGKMKLNEFGKIAEEEWLKSIEIRGNISLGEYVIMPNHIHGIIQINFSKGENNHTGEFKSPSQTIGAIIRGFKGAATKRIKIAIIKNSSGELQFAPPFAPSDLIRSIDLTKSIWQRDYYDIIIRDRRAYHNISNYIINNPVNWKEDKFHSH